MYACLGWEFFVDIKTVRKASYRRVVPNTTDQTYTGHDLFANRELLFCAGIRHNSPPPPPACVKSQVMVASRLYELMHTSTSHTSPQVMDTVVIDPSSPLSEAKPHQVWTRTKHKPAGRNVWVILSIVLLMKICDLWYGVECVQRSVSGCFTIHKHLWWTACSYVGPWNCILPIWDTGSSWLPFTQHQLIYNCYSLVNLHPRCGA